MTECQHRWEPIEGQPIYKCARCGSLPVYDTSPPAQEPVAWGVFDGPNLHDMFFTKEEAMKLRAAAEKVVELCSERPLSLGKWFIDMSEACESLREALAEQPAQQEPWLLETTQTLAKNLASKFYPEVTQWECLDNLAGVISQIDNMTTGLMRKPAQQEPVAYLCENAVGHKYFRWKKPSSTYKPIALYTSPPPQRTWVGLTKEEAKEISLANRPYVIDMIAALEARLKEKNGL